jgi:predicted RNase H-like nuclease (RuvC/YqgF family)
MENYLENLKSQLQGAQAQIESMSQRNFQANSEKTKRIEELEKALAAHKALSAQMKVRNPNKLGVGNLVAHASVALTLSS